MKSLYSYYVVDPIMESIVGSFNAPSDDAAKVVFKKSVLENDKMKSYGNSLVVYKQTLPLQILETYDEIFDTLLKVDLYE